jgi:hypothetical protein
MSLRGLLPILAHTLSHYMASNMQHRLLLDPLTTTTVSHTLFLHLPAEHNA